MTSTQVESLTPPEPDYFALACAEMNLKPISEAHKKTVIRGLGRSTIIGRAESGLPITLEGRYLEAIVRANELRRSESGNLH